MSHEASWNSSADALAGTAALERAEALLEAQGCLLEMAALGRPREKIFAELTEAVSRLEPAARACVLIASADCDQLADFHAVRVAASLGAGIRGAPIGDLAIGTCGKAIYEGRAITCVDIAASQEWSPPWRELCLAHGIRACHSTPVFLPDGQSVASFFLCFAEARAPSAWELRLAEFGVHLTSVVLQRDRTNETLRDQERRFRQMIDALPVAIYTTDAQGRVTYFNPAAVGLSGREPEIGNDRWCVTWKLLSSDGTPLPYEECPMAIALRQGRALRGAEAMAERPDGTRIWFQSYPSPIHDANGQVVGGINMLLDITDQKRAEAEREAELADTKLLQGISAELVEEADADALYEKIVRAAVSIMRSDFASMQALDPAHGPAGALRLLASHGFCPEASEYWRWVSPDASSSCGVALRTGRRVTVPDVVSCGFLSGTRDQTTYLDAGIRSLQSTPLFSRGGKLVGMISTHWKQPHHPSERDLRLLDILVRQAADLIDRRRTGDELRRHAERFEALLNNAPLGMYLVDADFRIREVNPVALPVFGNVPGGVVGRDFEEIIHILWEKPRADKTVRIFRHTLETGESYHAPEVSDFRIDRNVVEYYEWRVDRITLPEGRHGLVCYFRDISQQVLARERVAESERRLRFVMDAMPQKIFTARPNGEVDYFNPQWSEFTGLSFEQIKDWGWTQFVHPDDVEENVRAWKQAVVRGEPFQFEHRFRRADGVYRWHFSRAVAMRDVSGQVLMWIGSNTDIDDVKRVQDKLRASEAQFRGLFNQVTGGIAKTDLEGRFLLVNETFCRIVGRPSEEVLKLRMQDITHPDDLPGNLLLFERLPAGGADYVIEKRYLRPDGSVVWVNLNVAAVRDAAGQAESVIAVVLDVTERKAAEERLQKSTQALKDADRRKDEFLATLAHELRNPLAPIRNSLHILRLAGVDGGAAERVHDMMERQVNHLVRLVDDLMEVSRITRGKIELRRQRAELAGIVRGAVETSKPLIESSRHQLAIALPAEPLLLDADPMRVTQVLANLLNNAAKYTEPGGQIWLTARREGAQAVIAIRDSGIGIPCDVLPYVFDLFTQAQRALDRSQGGLGIGLTLVRSLVELHGGNVEARSDGPGQGSEFIVRLPLAEEPVGASGASQGNSRATPIAAQRILVVDHNRDAAESLGLLLKFLGADVSLAHDGPAALEALENYRPSVILLDIGMPVMDGLELARRIRQRPEGRELMLIALTGWGQEDDRRRSREAGLDHHLVKPVDVHTLRALLASVGGADSVPGGEPRRAVRSAQDDGQ